MSHSTSAQGQSHAWRWKLLGILAAGAVLSSAGGARARDLVSGTRAISLGEKEHSIEITVDRGFAKLVVRRTVFNDSSEHDQALFHIELPVGAVATGLRTLGTFKGRPRWFSGELLDAEVAAARYQELTGYGAYSPKDPALLSWRSLGTLALQVFPCAPKQAKTVEYTLLMPTRYEGGAHVLDLPMMGSSELLASVRLHAMKPGDSLAVNDQPIDDKARILLEWEHRVELRPQRAPQISGAFAAVVAGKEKALNRWHFELAPQLASVPRKARVVIVMDTSRSMGEARVAAAASSARAYLSHFHDAEVEIITFDRKPERRQGHFVSVEQAVANLASRAIGTVELGNGSQVEDALKAARQLFGNTPAGAARRVVLLTDTLSRSSFSLHALQEALAGSGALLHIGRIEVGAPALRRSDHHPWASAARRDGGVMWEAWAEDGADPALARSVYEEWARPVRLHHVELRAPGLDADTLLVPEELAEGEGLVRLQFASLPSPWVELRGELWSRSVAHRLMPNAAESKRWAALIFGSESFAELTDSEMLVLARRGGAVSPMTSYLAIEPGVRPSTEGLTDEELGGGGMFGHGAGTGTGMGFGGRRRGWDLEGILKALISPKWKACGGAPDTAEVALETTLDEIVDVARVKLDEANAEREQCLREAVWTLSLDDRFTSAWQEFVVRI